MNEDGNEWEDEDEGSNADDVSMTGGNDNLDDDSANMNVPATNIEDDDDDMSFGGSILDDGNVDIEVCALTDYHIVIDCNIIYD